MQETVRCAEAKRSTGACERKAMAWERSILNTDHEGHSAAGLAQSMAISMSRKKKVEGRKEESAKMRGDDGMLCIGRRMNDDVVEDGELHEAILRSSSWLMSSK